MSAAPSRFISVHSLPIELCQFIKFAGLAESGGEAKQLIAAGEVSLNGKVETQKSKKLASGDVVQVRRETLTVRLG